MKAAFSVVGSIVISTSATLLNCEFSGLPEFDIVMVASAVQSACSDDLMPSERRACAGMQPRRLREFAAGRRAARSALAYVGVEATEIPRVEKRYPLWPAGVCGSISHTRDIAVAAVCRDKRLAGIGIDIEQPSICGGQDMAKHLLTKREQESLKSLPRDDHNRHLARISCCKEAAYKAIYPITHVEFDFLDIEVEQAPDTNAYRISEAASARSTESFYMGHGRTCNVHAQLLSLFVVEACIHLHDPRCSKVDNQN